MQKKFDIVTYRQKTKVYGGCMMNEKMAHFVWWRTNRPPQRRIRDSSVVTDRIKAKIEAKIQNYALMQKTAVIFIEMGVVLSTCDMPIFMHFLNWLAFVHYITVNLNYQPIIVDGLDFFSHLKRRYKSVMVTFNNLGGIVKCCHTLDFSKSHWN